MIETIVILNLILIFVFIKIITRRKVIRKIYNSNIEDFTFTSRADNIVKVNFEDEMLEFFEITVDLKNFNRTYIQNNIYKELKISKRDKHKISKLLVDLFDYEINNTTMVNNVEINKNLKDIAITNNTLEKILESPITQFNFIYRINNYVKVAYIIDEDTSIFITVNIEHYHNTLLTNIDEHLIVNIYEDNYPLLEELCDKLLNNFKDKWQDIIEINNNLYSKEYAVSQMNVEILEENEYEDDEDDIDYKLLKAPLKNKNQEIDIILDIILKYGYESLTDEQKDILKKYK